MYHGEAAFATHAGLLIPTCTSRGASAKARKVVVPARMVPSWCGLRSTSSRSTIATFPMHVSATLPAPLTQMPSMPPLSYTSGHELWRGDRTTADEAGVGWWGNFTTTTSTKQRTPISEALYERSKRAAAAMVRAEALHERSKGAPAMVVALFIRQAEAIDHQARPRDQTRENRQKNADARSGRGVHLRLHGCERVEKVIVRLAGGHQAGLERNSHDPFINALRRVSGEIHHHDVKRRSSATSRGNHEVTPGRPQRAPGAERDVEWRVGQHQIPQQLQAI